jgi:hypothetical protein
MAPRAGCRGSGRLLTAGRKQRMAAVESLRRAQAAARRRQLMHAAAACRHGHCARTVGRASCSMLARETLLCCNPSVLQLLQSLAIHGRVRNFRAPRHLSCTLTIGGHQPGTPAAPFSAAISHAIHPPGSLSPTGGAAGTMLTMADGPSSYASQPASVVLTMPHAQMPGDGEAGEDACTTTTAAQQAATVDAGTHDGPSTPTAVTPPAGTAAPATTRNWPLRCTFRRGWTLSSRRSERRTLRECAGGGKPCGWAADGQETAAGLATHKRHGKAYPPPPAPARRRAPTHCRSASTLPVLHCRLLWKTRRTAKGR